MRSFILILMIALLPLRMWAAEGMSQQMAAASSGAPAGMASMDSAAMPADCPFMAATDGDPSGPSKDGAGVCASCQLCGAVAASEVFESAPALLPRVLLAPRTADAFQSALPLLVDKPPIS
ncbi:MAG: hypothetical protein EOO54_12620 [Haliea sp.]|nr:MAG: hypothetical protein EOO54_12620 [Haliea sp.]